MLFAQRSLRFTADTRITKEAENLMDMSYYQQAYLKLNSYLNNFRQDNKDKQVFEYQSACHDYLLCALKLDKPDAEANLIRFVQETPFTTLRQTGSFELGKYAYEHNRFDAAIRYYEAVGIELLTNQELIQRNFELGYSYLVTGQLDKVEPYFQSAKSIPGEYFKPGNYYHGLLAYYKKNYKEARESFIAVKEDERYKKIIPFYLTEIDYMSGEKEKALTAALQYLTSEDKLYYENELNQMVAQIYCEKEDYANAELYYTHYISKAKSVRDEDYFKLGYCQYAQGKTSDAITHLEMVSKNSVELSQHSEYLLAICYLKTDQKEKAVRSLEKYRALTGTNTSPEYGLKIQSLLDILPSAGRKYKTRFLVKQQEQLVPIHQHEIAYFFTTNELVCLVRNDNRQFLVDYRLEELEKLLDPAHFFRLNRQYIAALPAVQKIHTYFNGKLKLELFPEPSHEILISREKAPSFKEWIEG
jgi:DNA-binding LytR/AlgR family response regulator/predicted negative regulator of RcsB-dependent stress response